MFFNSLKSKATRERVAQLFFEQLKTLHDAECPELALKALRRGSGTYIDGMLDVWNKKYFSRSLADLSSEGIYLGIPVVPISFLDIHTLMHMIKKDNFIGQSWIDQSDLVDISKNLPKIPYYMLDVNNGSSTRSMSIFDADEKIAEDGRSRQTVSEGISMCILTNVIREHNIILSGSIQKNKEGVPYIGKNEPRGNIDLLFCYSKDIAFSDHGTPSCDCRCIF